MVTSKFLPALSRTYCIDAPASDSDIKMEGVSHLTATLMQVKKELNEDGNEVAQVAVDRAEQRKKLAETSRIDEIQEHIDESIPVLWGKAPSKKEELRRK